MAYGMMAGQAVGGAQRLMDEFSTCRNTAACNRRAATKAR